MIGDMALMMQETGILLRVAEARDKSVQLGVFQRKRQITDCTETGLFTMLRVPKSSARHGAAALIVNEFFEHLSPQRKKKLRIP